MPAEVQAIVFDVQEGGPVRYTLSREVGAALGGEGVVDQACSSGTTRINWYASLLEY